MLLYKIVNNQEELKTSAESTPDFSDNLEVFESLFDSEETKMEWDKATLQQLMNIIRYEPHGKLRKGAESEMLKRLNNCMTDSF